MKWTLYLLLGFYSCSGSSDTAAPEAPDSGLSSADSRVSGQVVPADTRASVLPEVFRQIPKEIQGCSGLYATDSAALAQGQYLFASDLQRAGFIQWKGKPVQVHQVANRQEGRDQTFRADSLEIQIIKGPSRQKGDELWNVEGVLYFRHGTTVDSVRVVGEEGC